MNVDTASDPTGPDRDRSRRLRAGLVAGGAAVGLTLAGLGVAAGQTGDTTTPPPAAQAPAAGQADPGPRPEGRGGPHRGEKGLGMGIHGEFTTRAPAGGYQTMASQVGEVTDVSASAVTVKSEDGYSRTYVVDDNTLVNAGNEGIADVKKGDNVRVLAIVKDGKANAVELQDGTQVGQLKDKWRPRRPAPAPAPGTAPNGSAPSSGAPSASGGSSS
ncbi:MAG: hypothetical protein QOK43_2135 [Acidimicrobiaceae bacterium]|nr:hypothetical protein [Acidimicrobiaceae bacterium]